MNLNLEGTTSLADFLAKVKARVDQAKPGAWVTGRGWIETFWQPQTFPTRADLDKVSPEQPRLSHPRGRATARSPTAPPSASPA